jgi:hypothetical protein
VPDMTDYPTDLQMREHLETGHKKALVTLKNLGLSSKEFANIWEHDTVFSHHGVKDDFDDNDEDSHKFRAHADSDNDDPPSESATVIDDFVDAALDVASITIYVITQFMSFNSCHSKDIT